jgi:lysine 2,3-aminomutase
MRPSLRTIQDLASAGLSDNTPALRRVGEQYAISVTPEMRELIDGSDPADPIAKQFLPDIRELDARQEEHTDPIGDERHSPTKGIVHRYPDRVLLKPVLICPVYCRFCFRREVVGPGGDTLSPAELERALEYIRSHTEIWEVIITGGDPLMLSPRRLGGLVEALNQIDHLKVIRWHSRVPIVDPQRVSAALTLALSSTDKAVWLAVHCNHPRELSVKALGALRRLTKAGITLVSQTVLLKGVNDDARILEALMRGFVEAGVRPYYLHQLDLAPGTSHFCVDIETGRAIMKTLRGRLSGIAQPTYVLDIPGGYGKVPAGPSYVEDALGGTFVVMDPNGEAHRYPPSIDD